MKKILVYSFILLVVILTGCKATGEASDGKVELTVSAAASMTDSLLEIKENFESVYPYVKINYNFGGSGTLRKQIEQGAGIDLFFSASEKDFQLLEEKGLVEQGDILFQNELVVIQPVDGEYGSFAEFVEGDGKLAIGTPEAVPAGTYAYQALDALEALDDLENRIVYTKDVRQVLTFVQENSVDMGIVYASDVIGEKDIKVLEKIRSEPYDPINYYLAVIEGKSKHSGEWEEAIDDFYQFVMSDEGMDIFKEYGFIVES